MDYIQVYNNMLACEDNPIDPSIQAPRAAAFEQLKHLGLPAKGNEKYKYTPLSNVFAGDYSWNAHQPVLPFNLKAECDKQLPAVDAIRIYTINGMLADGQEYVVDGVTLTSMGRAAKLHPECFKNHYNACAGSAEEDALTAMNTAFAPEGVFLHLAPTTQLGKPLMIVNAVYGTDALFSQQRNLFVFGEHCKASVIIVNISLSDVPSLSNNVTEVVVERSAHVEIVRLQNEGEHAKQLATVYAKQEANSHFNFTSVVLGGEMIRNNTSVQLAGEHCENHLYGIVLAKGQQHIDNYTFVDHAVPNCESNELYKGILNDKAVNVFNGRILVRRDAQKTLAFQSNRNIVLSDTAKMYTKPQLEIYADDVKCSHGATIGQLNNEELFYMQSRGIGLAEARLLLMSGFANEVLMKIGSPEIQQSLIQKIEERLK